MIKSERTDIVPFEMKYLNNYFSEFNAEITKFQYPDPFESIESAKTVLQEFLDETERGETLFFAILSKNGEFLGSVEIHGLSDDCPELGIWIIESEQGKGYAYEALDTVLDYVRSKYGKSEFYYEADIRNIGSTKLLRKFDKKYEIIEQGVEKLTTESEKKLELQGYILRAI
ncbi:MAG: GNAT family N-acetyltransferase [Eubacterium sp.]|nr:GNAT family N-acetyltransferase [Eubacterium sp.]